MDSGSFHEVDADMFEFDWEQSAHISLNLCLDFHYQMIIFIDSSEPTHLSHYDVVIIIFIGERAKRARRYLVMFMETRDIYIFIYVRLFLMPMRSVSLGYADPPSILACAR